MKAKFFRMTIVVLLGVVANVSIVSGGSLKAPPGMFKDLNDEGKTLILATHDRLVAGRARVMIKVRDGKVVKGKKPPKDGTIHLKGERKLEDRKR